MKEFKENDECFIKCKISKITGRDDLHPIEIEINGWDETISFTSDGRYSCEDNNKSLFHIEDMALKPEFPKWMMVKTGVTWEKRNVIAKDDTGYCYIMYGKDEISAGIGVVSLSSVKEIEPENNKLQELEEKYKKLSQEIEKLKNKQ